MIAEILKDEVQSISVDKSIKKAIDLLHREDLSEVIITDGGRYSFMLREIDLVGSLKKELAQITSEKEGYFAYEDEHFLKSLQKMHINDLSVLPVVDQDMMYTGALRKDDLLDYLCEQYIVSGNESIIIIERAMRDYSLAMLSRIIEAEGGKVLGVFIGPKKMAAEKIWISLTVQTSSLNQTISALERHEYEIIAHLSGEENENMIKERYESLMTFLNV